jgi:hypothetical protein
MSNGNVSTTGVDEVSGQLGDVTDENARQPQIHVTAAAPAPLVDFSV